MVAFFKNNIEKNFPFLKESRLLIAVSGGVDSVVLTDIFYKLGYSIAMAHCNFNLRANESDEDEQFVCELAKKIEIPVFVKNFDTESIAKKNKESIQITARKIRYQWFDELCKNHHFDYVLTAHHADDNLETFIINFTRGTGLDGLLGIPPMNGNIVRPLLNFSREDIKNFANHHHIHWREDQSNAATKYVRNKIRHQIVPILKELNPSLLHSFENTIANLNNSKHIIQDKIDEVKKTCTHQKSEGVLSIQIDKINQLSEPKAYLFHLLHHYGFTQWNDIAQLITAKTGKYILSNTHRLLKNRGELLLTQFVEKQELEQVFIEKGQKSIVTPIQLEFSIVTQINQQNQQNIYVDATKILYPMLLRKWEHGDYFYPSGMQGKKKLSKYFKDQKFSLLEKEQTWLLCNGNNEIIWVIGYRQDQRFIATDKCKKNLYIRINNTKKRILNI